MRQKTLFKEFSRLSEHEFTRFTEFVSSSFFNRRNDVIRFTQYLKPLFPEFPEKQVSDNAIYKNVYGAESVNKQVVKNLFGRTLSLLERFLIQLALESDEIMQVSALVKELKRKNLNTRADKILNDSIDQFSKDSDYTLDTYRKQNDLLELKHGLVGESNSKEKILSNSKRFSALIKSTLVSLLKIANDYEVYSFVESAPTKTAYIENITGYIDFEKALKLIQETEPEEYPLIACYYYGLKSKTDDPDNIFREKLKDLCFENIERFRQNDNIEFWQMIFSSYIFSRAQKGPVDVKTLHQINKIYIDKNVVHKDAMGFIEENNYHNITMQAIAAGDMQWAENFIEKYAKELNPETKENTYNFLMGYFMLNKGEYNKVIPYLSRIRSGDIPVHLTIRWMYIRTYYELGHYFEAESAILAFKKFISASGRVTKESRSTYPLSLDYISAVVKSRISGKSLGEEKYLKAKNSSFIAKKWVIEKMEELLHQ